MRSFFPCYYEKTIRKHVLTFSSNSENISHSVQSDNDVDSNLEPQNNLLSVNCLLLISAYHLSSDELKKLLSCILELLIKMCYFSFSKKIIKNNHKDIFSGTVTENDVLITIASTLY